MRSFVLPFALCLLVYVSGCAAMFGTPAYDAPVYVPASPSQAGTVVMPDGSVAVQAGTVTVPAHPGYVQQGAAVAGAAGAAGVPYAGLIAGALALIGAAGTAVQSWRLKGSVKVDDVATEAHGIAADPLEMPVTASLQKARTPAGKKILKAMAKV